MPALVSVVIPAYNQAGFLGAAIESIQAQTYPHWELWVVDDGSTDSTAEVAGRYLDTRIHLLRQANKGLPGARNTGIAAAQGKYLAFLDADDTFHPEKLAAQVAHLEQHPEVGLSYASRIEIDGEGSPCWLLRAPARAGLKEMLLGFPFTINDILVRRSLVEEAGSFDESFRLHSEDRDFYLRLALSGCTFARLNRFVAFRRIHTRREFNHIPERIATMGRALETAFSDPRCPVELQAIRDQAYARIYLTWACQEFVQQETQAAQAHLREAVRLDPAWMAEDGRAFLEYLTWFSLRDGGDHVESLECVFAGLPGEWGRLKDRQTWAIARGYLIRGGRDLLWGRVQAGKEHFARAIALGAKLDQSLLDSFSDQLSSYAQEYGAGAARQAWEALVPHLKSAGTPEQVRGLASFLSINQAFSDYRRGQYSQVPGSVLRAVMLDPRRLADWGVIAILARSLVKAPLSAGDRGSSAGF